MVRSSTPAHLVPLLVVAALALSACDRKPKATSLDTLDNQLVNGTVSNAADPAGLRSVIKVDPGHGKTGAKPDTAQAQADDRDCLARYGNSLAYANDWAGKLPPELPLPPKAQLTEAAGHDGGCHVRAVSFALPGARNEALDWYTAKGKAAGYAIERVARGGDLILGGSKGDAGFDVIVGPPANGTTPVDLVWAQKQ